MRLSQRVFKHNKLIDNVLMFFIPYHWAYKKGFADGMKESNYYTGFTDGQEEAMKFVIDSHRKFFDNPELRQNGKIEEDGSDTPTDPKLP